MQDPIRQAALDRFYRYISVDTASDPDSTTAPSSDKQLVLARMLVEELKALGVADARLTQGGVVMGSIAATAGCEKAPAVGFIAHMDTSPEACGGPVNHRLVHYTGGDIVLNKELDLVLSPERFPEMLHYLDQDLIVTDGTTLLGADDKAGITAIMGMVEHFKDHADEPHAKICIAFTPDEEIGRGTENFDVKAFGADYAYTIDGGEVGHFDMETFSAARAKVTFNGVAVHPGSAKGKMLNALRLCSDFVTKLPMDESPETTEGHEGFMHPNKMEGSVREAHLTVILRDHDNAKLADKKARFAALCETYNAQYGEGTCEVSIVDQYENMKTYLDPVPKVCDIAREAFRNCGLDVIEEPVRGGSDGSRLCVMGLPCPNYFAGGLNFHGVFEYLPVNSMLKAQEVVIETARLAGKLDSIH